MQDGTRLSYIRDITERKREYARVRRLVESNVQGVMLLNTKGDIVTANDAFPPPHSWASSGTRARIWRPGSSIGRR